MGLMFGTQDHIECMTQDSLPGPKDEQLCLASKISLHFLGAGVYVSRDHVLRIKGSSSYYPLSPTLTAELQRDGMLPTPLPPIRVAWYEYALGYSLWLVLGFVGVSLLLQRLFDKRTPFLRADVAPSAGPPMIRTDEDRWLATEVARQLSPGERVEQQALGFDGDPELGAAARFCALTNQRLLFIATRRGLRGAKLENHGLQGYRREDIVAVGQNHLVLWFDLADGTRETLWVAASQRTFTNQWLFARDTPRLLLGQHAGGTHPG